MAAQQVCPPELIDKFKDQWWRLNNLYWIMNEKGQKIKFVPNFAQDEFYGDMWYLNIVLKARQLGFTTFIDIFLLDVCLFNSNLRAGIITDNRENAESVFRDKVRFAYDNLPAHLKTRLNAKTDAANELMFNNGSAIRVGTTMRGITNQYLHVSEFGKICAKYPERAKEIITGAFNTVHAGQFIFVESTAEGQGGYFYDMTQEAINLARLGRPLNELQFKFHFFPWYMDMRYTMDPDTVILTDEDILYFQKLRVDEGIELTPGQMAWYVAKKATQKDNMKREYPTTPKEAFEAAIEGAWYAREMALARSQGRICQLPIYSHIPVNTFWDLGRNDLNALWFHQRVGPWNNFIKYYENDGYSLSHYVKYIKDFGDANQITYGRHYIPHDGEHETVGMEKNVRDQLWDMGLRGIETVDRIARINDGIEMVRNVFPSCRFDETGTADGIKALDMYRRKFDPKLACFLDIPLHDAFSNGADAFRGFAQGYVNHGTATQGSKRKKRRPTSAMTA